jgi:hypothetical protein
MFAETLDFTAFTGGRLTRPEPAMLVLYNCFREQFKVDFLPV